MSLWHVATLEISGSTRHSLTGRCRKLGGDGTTMLAEFQSRWSILLKFKKKFRFRVWRRLCPPCTPEGGTYCPTLRLYILRTRKQPRPVMSDSRRMKHMFPANRAKQYSSNVWGNFLLVGGAIAAVGDGGMAVFPGLAWLAFCHLDSDPGDALIAPYWGTSVTLARDGRDLRECSVR